MRILWTVNLIPTELAKEMQMPAEVLGGWVEAMTGQLRGMEDVQLAIACKTKEEIVFQKEIAGVTYYSLNYDNLQARCTQILEDYKPDLIQIEGTEFLHA